MTAGLAFLALPLLAGPAPAADFSNAAPIVLPRPGPPPGCPTSCPSEKAGLYPSAIAVSGLSGTVTDVNVTLRNVTYEYNGLPDADVLLVAPGGKAVMVMSDACGDDDNPNPSADPITLTLDDQAGTPLPGDAACSSGTFRPFDDDDDGEFPFHVADGFTDGPSAPAATRPLSDLNGIDPNGSWSLYVVDDYPNDPDPSGRAGQIGGGWTVDIVTTAAPAPAPPSTAAPAPPTTTAPPATTATPRSPTTVRGTPTTATVPPTVTSTTAASESTTSSTAIAAASDADPSQPTSSATAPVASARRRITPWLVAAAALLLLAGLLVPLARRRRASRARARPAGFAGAGHGRPSLRHRLRRRRLRRRMGV